MKKLIWFIGIVSVGFLIGTASAQSVNPQTGITWPRVTGSGVPTATCPSASNTTTTATVGTPYTNTTANTQYVCSTGGWTLLGSGSGLNQLTGDVTAGPGTGSQAATVHGINNTILSGLATGILKNTTGTGVPSIAVAADIPGCAGNCVTQPTLFTGLNQVPVGASNASRQQVPSNFTMFADTNTDTISTTDGRPVLIPPCVFMGSYSLPCNGGTDLQLNANVSLGGATILLRDFFAETTYNLGYSAFMAANNVAPEHSVWMGVNPSTIPSGVGASQPDAAYILTELDNLDLNISGKTVNFRGGNQLSTNAGLSVGAANAVIMPLLSGCLAADATTHILTGTGSVCGSGGGAVSSVSNSDGTLTISPTTGAVVASIALGHANTWSGQQTFVAPILGTPASGNGSNLTALNATQLTSGTVPSARLPLATNAAIGGMEGDGTTLTCVAGVCSTLGAPPTGTAGGVLAGTYPNPGYAATAGSHTVLGNTAGTTGTPSFTVAPVVTSILAGTSLLNGTGINTSGNDFTFNISSANLFLATTSNATNVQIQAGNTFTLGALSGCLSADATTHVVTGTSAICANTTSTSLTSGFVPKANGANSLINSSIQDTGSAVNLTEPLFGTNLNASGTIIDSAAGGSSTPAISATGTPFAGTGTTSVPLLYENGGTAPTTFSTAGTYFGVNAVSAFAGNFLDFHVNGGASVSKLDASGNLTVASCTGCGGGLSGMTATQVAIAGSATTITSSKALAPGGPGIPSGPVTGTIAGDIVQYNSTTGQQSDSGVSLPLTVNPSRSLDATALGDSITSGTGASNTTASPSNTSYMGFSYRMGGIVHNYGVSGYAVVDLQKVEMLGQMAAVPCVRAPNYFSLIGTNDFIQAGAGANQLALYGVSHQAMIAFITICSDNYNGGAWNSGTTYLLGDVVQSGGISYIATGGTGNLPPNLNKTPASNTGYWAVYLPPTNHKIAALTANTQTGWVPDISVQGISGSQVQALGLVSAVNGTSLTLNIPTPSGNPIYLEHRIMDGNSGTASVTIDGSAPGSNATISGGPAGGASIKATTGIGNSDVLALVRYPTTATGAPCVPASSSLTSNVATIVCTATFAGSVNNGVGLLGLTNLPFLNGLSPQVQSVSGTSFTVNFTHANVTSAAEPTTATATPGHLVNITVSSTPNTCTITNIAIASNVVTGTCTNTFSAGNSLLFYNIGTATFLNGVTLTVATASGSSFTASGTATSGNGQWAHANYSSTADTGNAAVNWIAPWFLGTYPASTTVPVFQQPRLQVIGVPQQQNNANAAGTAAYNAQALTDQQQNQTDGGFSNFVDIRNGNGILPGVNSATDMNDSFHPNDAGHAKIQALVESALQVHESGFQTLCVTGGVGVYNCLTASSTNTYLGNGTAQNASGTLNLTGLNATGTVKGSVVYCTNEVIASGTTYSQSGSECGVRLTNTAARTVTLAANFTAPFTIDVHDAANTAGTGNISVVVSGGGTIDGLVGGPSSIINVNGGSAKFRYVSSGVWETVQPTSNQPGLAAITSATPAAGVTSVTCATATCTIARGTYAVVGGTATTGTFATLLWPTTTTAYVCSVTMNGGTGFLGLGHSVATATGMTVSAGVTILGTTFNFDYECQP